MKFLDAIKLCMTTKYCCFKGRASRSEYWWFTLFTVILSLIGNGLPDVVGTIISLVVFLPSMGVAVRRLHDVDMNGWWCLAPIAWFLLCLSTALVATSFLLVGAAFIGFIAIVFIMARPGTPGPNRFGEPVVGVACGTAGGVQGAFGNASAHPAKDMLDSSTWDRLRTTPVEPGPAGPVETASPAVPAPEAGISVAEGSSPGVDAVAAPGHEPEEEPRDERFCPACGTAVSLKDNFCMNCGHPLKVATPTIDSVQDFGRNASRR